MNGNDRSDTDPQSDKIITDVINKLANEKHYKKYSFEVTQTFDKGENYLGVIQRATLEGIKENGETETLKLIIKTPPLCMQGSEIPIDKYYNCEHFAYSEYFPLLLKIQAESNIPENERIHFAKCHVSTMEKLKEVVIFEDLNANGYKMYDRMISLDLDHSKLLIKTLATYHALGFALKNHLSKQEYSTIKEHSVLLDEFNEEYFKLARDMIERLYPLVESADCRNMLENFGKSEMRQKTLNYLNYDKDENETEYNIMAHADCWTNNMLFKYLDNSVTDMILLDWQTIKFAPPTVDLVYAMFLCLDEATRDKHWNDLLDIYYDTLRSRLMDLNCDPDKVYPRTIFQKHLKGVFTSGYVFVVLSVMLPFTLTNKEDSIDMNDILDGGDGSDFDANKVKLSDECLRRLNGSLRHLLKTFGDRNN